MGLSSLSSVMMKRGLTVSMWEEVHRLRSYVSSLLVWKSHVETSEQLVFYWAWKLAVWKNKFKGGKVTNRSQIGGWKTFFSRGFENRNWMKTDFIICLGAHRSNTTPITSCYEATINLFKQFIKNHKKSSIMVSWFLWFLFSDKSFVWMTSFKIIK